MSGWNDEVSFKDRFKAWLNGMFPDRQIHIRTHNRIKFFRIPQWTQVTAATLLIAVGGWLTYTTSSYLRHNDVIVSKDTQIADARKAYDTLLNDVDAYQRRFAELTNELEDNHNLMLSLVERNATLQRNLSTVERRLKTTETERQTVADARETLRGKLSNLENEMRSLSSKNFSLRDNLVTVETDLQTVIRERDLARYSNNRLENQVTALEDRLNNLQDAQEIAVERMTERTMTYIESLSKVVEIAGIEVDTLLDASNEIVSTEARGGPFIPIAPAEAGGELMGKLTRLDDQLGQWEILQQIMARLPLTAPLNTYYVTSPFGKRRDPINKRWSAHYGTDFGGPMKQPIYAPAPGVVTKAGTKGRYGRFIEIDHGSGIKTRYGHLHRINVKRGERVEFRQKIGQLGNSGRSTGPHLHYEVVFNGKPRDPMKFIKAGRHVFQKQ